jgi:predicted XRE-type DNA-binding protein
MRLVIDQHQRNVSFYHKGVALMKKETDRKRNRFGKPFERQLSRNQMTGCLEWTGKIDKDGYGRRGSRYGQKRSHRHAYELAYGLIPDGKIVRHKCDNPKCCEPTHLLIGDHSDNIADKVSRKRVAKGEKGGRAKLTNEMVLEIRRLYSQGVRQTEIANRFPVTQSSISLIVLRKQWGHI